MEKGRYSNRESRRFRNKQVSYEANNHHGLHNTGVPVTSVTRGNVRGIITDEGGCLQRSRASRMSPQDDYVQTWLAQTMKEVEMPSSAGLEFRKEDVSRLLGAEGRSREFDFEPFLQVKDYGASKDCATAQHESRKHMLETSSDCSFLEQGFASEQRLDTREESHAGEGTKKQEKSTSRQQRQKLKDFVPLEGSVDSLSIAPPAVSFERRRRHKTREDRYEPRNALVEPISKVNRERRRGSHRKGFRKIGEDLMHQFSSKSIGHDRLTLRPSNKTGLFKHGRASAPRGWRGLPDLAFSEMEFLRYSNQRSPEIEEEKPVFKSREKEKRRSERAQNEISEYFKPHAKVPIEVENHNRQQVSYIGEENYYRHRRGEYLKKKHQSSYSKSTSQSIEFSKEPFLGFDRREAFERLAATPRLRGQMVQPGMALDIVKKLSDNDTTYFTWSDSLGSPGTSHSIQKTCSVVSTTPESIHQLLNDTGIFTNTGIGRTRGPRHETASKVPVTSEVRNKPRGPFKFSNPLFPSMRTHTISRTKQQSQKSTEVVENIPKGPQSPHEARETHLDERSRKARDDVEILRPPKAIIQHYALESGWQQHSIDGEAVAEPHLSKADVSKKGIPRQMIAQEAYVKHARTVDTVVRGVDETSKATLSARDPKIDTTMPHQRDIEQAIYKEINAETSDQYPPLSNGSGKQGRDSRSTQAGGIKLPADTHNSNGKLQPPNPAALDQSALRQLDTIAVADRVPGPSQTVETIPSPPDNCKGAHFDMDSIGRPDVVRQHQVNSDANVFEGLPLRGSWPGRSSGPIPSLRVFPTPVEVKPLYSHQLGNMGSHDSIDLNYYQNLEQDRRLRQFDILLAGDPYKGEDEPYDTFEGEEEPMNGTQRLQGFDAIPSNTANPRGYVADGEEEPFQWELQPFGITHQTAAGEDSHEGPNLPDSLYHQEIPVVNVDLHEEVNYNNHLYEPARKLVREGESMEYHGLNRFWRPHRHY